MRAVMGILIALLVLGGLSLLGYVGYQMWQQQQLGAVAPVQGEASSSAPSSTAELGVRRVPNTHADIMEALDYEIRQNPDTVGWLMVPDTTINNSVVQSYNNSYYLRQTERKVPDTFGCYFVDYECSVGAREEFSDNTVIYGHSDIRGDNPEGPKFSQLYHFTDLEFAKEHPVVYFSTPEDYLVWEIFAVFYTDVTMDYIGADYEPEAKLALIEAARELSLYDYEVEVTEEDRILTLSTCSVKYGNDGTHRFVVMAKLLPPEACDEPPVSAAISDQ